jgi:hypothetical protein
MPTFDVMMAMNPIYPSLLGATWKPPAIQVAQ